ncbi:MAG: type III-B CRISPR module RAMP protein Cmr4 [Syntrophomonadaceae bacterium]|nr:type III-B CRISPR module RAMP protein Cmr4 [Syntrophomonadaceae bacterium]
MNKIYIIRALTNMHVGDGQADYNIIDNQVQRDALTEVPVIHASSLKGALLHYSRFQQEQENIVSDDMLKNIFGNSESAGQYRFLDGHLLSIPVRGRQKPFYMATCPMIIRELLELAAFLQIDISFKKDLEQMMKELPFTIDNEGEAKILAFTKKNADDNIEGLPVHFKECEFQNQDALEHVFGADLVLFTDKEFKEYVKELPVIARNKLNNGESVNLWYEEIVPRESRFYFGLYQGARFQTAFNQILTGADYMQVGANATVGYGYIKIFDICAKAGDSDA